MDNRYQEITSLPTTSGPRAPKAGHKTNLGEEHDGSSWDAAKKLFDEIKAPVWERYADQGKIRYSLNRKHPLVQLLDSKLEEGSRKQT